VVPWVYKETAREAIEELRMNNEEWGTPIQIVAVEQDENSVDYREIGYKTPVALLVGNETFGVTKETLKLCDTVAEIPMWGINKSLNVIVSAAIVGFHAASSIKK
jgi:tRNA (guanosine-2'-O-)-methyltransferase